MISKISESIGDVWYEAGASPLRLSGCQYSEFGYLVSSVVVRPFYRLAGYSS